MSVAGSCAGGTSSDVSCPAGQVMNLSLGVCLNFCSGGTHAGKDTNGLDICISNTGTGSTSPSTGKATGATTSTSTTSTTSTTTNSDGSTTTTTTTTTDGTSTSVGTAPAVDMSATNSKLDGIKGSVDGTNGKLDGIKGALDGIKDSLAVSPKGNGAGTLTHNGVVHNYGGFDDSLDTELTATKLDFKTTMDTIKSEFSALTTSVSSTNGLPSFFIADIRGQHIIVDFNRWHDALQPLSNAFYLIFVLAAAFIILGS
ncbi:MAG: hypothetical protein QX189_09275 [Methylococcales bacterium]